MTIAYVGIGSNIDKHRHIAQAIERLRLLDGGLRLSTIYECPAIGFSGDCFFNLVVELSTDLSLSEFHQQLRQIEYQLGRRTDAKKRQDRTIDLDIILFGDDISECDPAVPRSDIYKYPFVIQPLYELCPDLIIPADGRTIRHVWQTSEWDDELSPIPLWF